MTRKAYRDLVELWRKRLQRQAQGKSSVADFCRREGVSQASFYRWRKRVDAGSWRAHGKQRVEPVSDPEFVPVELPTSLSALGVQIELPGGSVVRLPQDASAEIVAAAVQAVCAIEFSREAQRC